jgi:hypothetical protein
MQRTVREEKTVDDIQRRYHHQRAHLARLQNDFLSVDGHEDLPHDYLSYLEWAGKPPIPAALAAANAPSASLPKPALVDAPAAVSPEAREAIAGYLAEIDGIPFSPGRIVERPIAEVDTEDPLAFFRGVYNGLLATAGILMLAWVAYKWLIEPWLSAP